MRLDKQAHHCNVRNIQRDDNQNSRSGRDWKKDKALTRGELCNHELIEQSSQQTP